MTDAARGSKNGDQSAAQEDSARVSGPQARYEPWPIGSEAFATPLAPRHSEPPRFSRRARLLWVVVGGAVGAAAGALALGMLLRPTPAPAAAKSVAKSAQVSHAEPQSEAPAPKASLLAAVEPPPQPSAPPTAVREESAAAPAREPTPSVTAAIVASSASGDSHKHHSHESHPQGGKLPQQLDRAQVIAAMNAVRPSVLSCFGAARGSVTANVRIAGASGRITSVQVSGQPGQVGSCVARAVRGARFPHFAADSLAISYPFGR